jgi:Gpi18-like mannosyltransferase
MSYEQKGVYVFLFIGLCIALLLRYKLIGAETFDYTNFLHPWIESLRAQGLSALNGGIPGGNYNAPYYLLHYIGTWLPFSDLVIVKLISIFFDLVAAFGVFMVVRLFRPNSYIPHIAALTMLFLPTVFLNSALWGQCDIIYTTFIIFSLYYSLKNNPSLAWLMWGIAISFKLQAIFFLPVLAFITFNKRWRLRKSLWAVLAFLVLSSPPIFYGASLESVVHVYINQISSPTAGQPVLSWFSPTLGQLMPAGDVFHSYFKYGLLLMAAGAATVFVMTAFLIKNAANEKRVYVMASAFGVLLVAFLLPGIHERYLFSGELLLLLAAFISHRMIVPAVAMQVVTMITYNSYFTGGSQPPQISYAVLSLVVLAILCWLARELYLQVNQVQDRKFTLHAKKN